MPTRHTSERGTTRRKVIGVVGGTLPLLAGCQSGGDGSGDDGGPSGGGSSSSGSNDGGSDNSAIDSGSNEGNVLRYPLNGEYQEFHSNFFNYTNLPRGGSFNGHLGDRWFHYDFAGDVEYALLGESFEVDGDTLRVEMNPDYVWHNGEEVTIEDAKRKWTLDWYMRREAIDEHHEWMSGYPLEDAVPIETVDEHTIEIDLQGEFNRNYFLEGVWNDHHDRLFWGGFEDAYEPWRERFLDATTEDEIRDVQEDLLQYRWELDDVVGYGPFTLGNVSDTEIRMEKFEDHPHSDRVLIDEIVFKNFEDTRQGLLEDQIDISGEFPVEDELMQQMPGGGDDVSTDVSGNPSMLAVGFNNDQFPFDRREARQAIACILDKNELEEFSPANITKFDPPSTG